MRGWTWNRLGAAAILLAALMVLVSGALPVEADKHLTGLSGGELRVAVLEDLDLNPFTATSDASWNAIEIVYDSIARIDAHDLVPVPWAATGWTLSGTELTVTLRDDLQFHDGSSLAAADVIYSYNAYKTLGLVPSDLAVSGSGAQATFNSTTGGGLFFGRGLTLPIVKDGTGLTNDPVGSGPFEPVSTAMPVTVAANADHFMPPFLSEVTFSRYDDTQTASEDLIRGNIDFIGWTLGVSDPGSIIVIDGQNRSLVEDASVFNHPGLTHLTVGYNTSAGRATGDHEFRLALSNALSPLLYSLINPSADVSRSPIIDENTPWYNPDVPVYQYLTYFPDRRATAYLLPSEQILDAAGYVDQDGDGWRDMPDGSPLQPNIVGRPDDEDPFIFTIQTSLTAIFTDLEVNATLEQVTSENLTARLESGDFEVFVASLDTTLDPSFLWDYYHSNGTLNYFRYSNSTLDDALAAADAALDIADRQAQVDSIQYFVMSEAVGIPVLHFDAIEAAVRGSFEGWVSMPGGINNFWTYMNLHVAQVGSLTTDVSVVPVSATSGGDVVALVKAADQDGAAVADVSISVLADGAVVATGTTDASGSLSVTFSAPSVSDATDVEIAVEASKPGYVGARDSASMTVRPIVASLVVSVASDEVSIGPDDSATITVTVRDGAGSAVSGAVVSLSLIGQGGALDDVQGTTGSAGTFSTTFTADVGARTLFRVEATASLSGFVDGSGSTSVLGEQRVGEIEPRLAPFFDWGAIIVAIVVVAIIVLYLIVRRR